LREAGQTFLHEHEHRTFPDHQPPESRRFLRVMTYNVHTCVGMDGRLSPRRIARVIAQSDADVIALQELDAHRGRTNHEDQAHAIARHLEMDYHFHPAWQVEEEKYGDAILSRFPIHLVKADSLLPGNHRREPRGALWVELELPWEESRLQILNTHLSIYPKERYEQAAALFTDGWIDEAWKCGPVILAGDFNAHPGMDTYELMAKRLLDVQISPPSGTAKSAPSSTWISRRPLVRIDHIFTSHNDFCVHSARVIDSQLAANASDHLPLVADLELVGLRNEALATNRNQAAST